MSTEPAGDLVRRSSARRPHRRAFNRPNQDVFVIFTARWLSWDGFITLNTISWRQESGANCAATANPRQLEYDGSVRHGREGYVAERAQSEIGMHAVSGGDIVGEHTVFYAGLGERIELTHRALSRDNFAQGALKAASWLNGKHAGLYDMQDVLGLK